MDKRRDIEKLWYFDTEEDFSGRSLSLSRKVDLKSYNDYETIGKSPDWIDWTDSESLEFDFVAKRILKIYTDKFILQASEYGISRYERILGIEPGKNESLEDRRKRVYLLWNKKIRWTHRTLLNWLNIFVGESNYRIKLTYNEYELEVELLINNKFKDYDIYKELRDIIPANLGISIKYGFVSSLVLRTQYGDHVNPQYLCGEEKCGDIPWEIKADNKVFNLRVRTENYNSKNYYALPSDEVPTGIEYENLIDETIFIQDFASKDIYEFKDKE